jgi:hypothetical protein
MSFVDAAARSLGFAVENKNTRLAGRRKRLTY